MIKQQIETDKNFVLHTRVLLFPVGSEVPDLFRLESSVDLCMMSSKRELIFSMQFLILAFNEFQRLYFLAFFLGLPLAFVYRSFCYRRNATIQVITYLTNISLLPCF